MGEERGKKLNRQRYFVFFVFFVFFFSAAFNLYRLKDILLYIEFLPIEYHSTQIMESYNFIFIFVGKEIFFQRALEHSARSRCLSVTVLELSHCTPRHIGIFSEFYLPPGQWSRN